MRIYINGLLFILLLTLKIWAGEEREAHGSRDWSLRLPPCDSVSMGYQCSPKMSHRWGTNSPFYSVPSRISNAIPPGCEITFVNVLLRHGARFPTAKKTEFYRETVEYVQRYTSPRKLLGKYAFLKKYRFNLGVGHLTLFGQQELVNAGVQFFRRYPDISKRQSLFLRSAGMERVVLSGLNFSDGFHMEKSIFVPDKPFPYPMLIIPEGPTQNSTLSHDVCPAYEHGPKTGKKEMAKWAAVFVPPIAARLGADLGVHFDIEQTLAMMNLCPFETVADSRGRISDFCHLFTTSEWNSFSHYETLNKWYGSGPGNPLGPTQGVGYVNELIARLTSKPVVDRTSTNHTLDMSAVTFPLQNYLYADFTHNTDMVAVMFALNLFDHTPPQPYKRSVNAFTSDSAVPFAARIAVEKMVCTSRKSRTPELVRILINDRVVPLRSCNADRYGRCTVENYVHTLTFAKSMGEWEKCYV